MQCICGPFFKKLFMFFERFCQLACFFAARFTLRQPKTPVWNATNLRTFCFEDYHYAFQETPGVPDGAARQNTRSSGRICASWKKKTLAN